MGDTGQVSVIALGVGAGSLVAAAVGVLLRRTAGLTGTRRLPAMARLAGSSVWAVLPAGWAVASTAAGLLAFAAMLAVGVAVTVLIVRAISPEVPNPTEAYEGVGDAMMAMFRFYVGAMLSFVVACVVGFGTGSWMASRWGTGGRTEPLHAIERQQKRNW